MAQTTHIQIRDGNTNYGNITGSFNKTVYKCDEDTQIMRWLSPLEPNNRHQSIRTDRFQGVGCWLLETSEFREWRENEGGADKAILFCSGDPGAGKTYLSSLVIDSLYDQEGGADATIAYLYCDYLSQQEQTVTNMMGAILRQLVGGGGIPSYLREKYQEAKNKFGGRGLLLPDLMRMLRITIASIHQVFICVDALDEFLPKHLPDLLKSLRDIVQEFPTARIFLTGRPHVKEDIQRFLTKAVVMPISPNADDIRNYLEMRLDNDAEPAAMNDSLRADIVNIILERISDIFLLVSLNMDAILGEVTILQRRRKLEAMTKGNGLSDAYTATLTRLKAQKGNKSTLGMKVLMWAVYSERPLQAEELCHALGVEVGSADLDIENIPAVETLIGSSLGLVSVEASSSTVRLVHFTLKEHLTSDPTLFPSPHSTIADVCLTYLNFGSIRDLSPLLYRAPQTTPLLDYASHYWGDHTRREMTENTKILALRLLNRFDEHISAQLILSHYGRNTHSPPFYCANEEHTRFTGLHAVSFLGIVGIVGSVLEMKEWNFDATDCCGSTALTWAAGRGHEGVVRMLLGRSEVNPDQADTEYGRTPLSWAAEDGHEGVVRMLLERSEVNPDRADTKYGQTPLSLAAHNGHEGVVKILLERSEVNPDRADTKHGQTPLSSAAVSGHEGVVRMLLERSEVNPDQPDTKYGQTPLSWAAHNGHEGVVKILLERSGVNPDRADTKYGLTPLSLAAMSGHEGVVKALLERAEVNPDQADTKYGRAPLSRAAENGHEGVVKMLLERSEVNPDQADTRYGRTPPSRVAGGGLGGVVKMLLERAEAGPDPADTEYGRTPLSRAAGGGHEGVVKMLLERSEVNPDQPDTKYGQTPLSWAAMNGREEVVKILLERAEVNPDRPDTKYGQTPLLWAAQHGHDAVVKTLLSRNDVRTDTPNYRGQTPLSLALSEGQGEVVRILQEREKTNSHTADLSGQPSVLPPIGPVDESVVEVQSQSDDPRTDITDLDDQQALPPADPGEQDGISDINGPVSNSPDNDLPPTAPPTLSQPPPTLPLKPCYPTSQNDVLPSNTLPTPSIPVAWYFIIASPVCLLALLVYVVPSLLDIFLFHK